MSIEEMVACLARYFIQVKVGERLDSVRKIATVNAVSVGTVSNTLAMLEASGALQIERRGRLGAFLAARSIGGLWALAEREPMVISFPLIAHPRLEGLATALKQQISASGIDVFLIFVRGSRTRLKLLRENKCHLAIMSNLAATKLISQEEHIALCLPPESFVRRHEVFFRANLAEIHRRLRVAIDRDSLDIEHLTELEFVGQDVEFHTSTFMQLPRLLHHETVDAGVWSLDDMERHLSERIHHRSLSEHVLQAVGESDTEACLVARREKASVQAVVSAALNSEIVLQIQQEVMNGERVPEY